MGGRRDYTRWDYDDETEITTAGSGLEEQLTLDEAATNQSLYLGGSAESLASTSNNHATTFSSSPNVLLCSNSPIRTRATSSSFPSRGRYRIGGGESSSREGFKWSARRTSMKEKAQLCVLSAGILLLGFITGFGIGMRENSSGTSSSRPDSPKHSKHFSTDSHEHGSNDLIFHQLLSQISAHNIRDNLKTMTREEHRSGTEEGREMVYAIRNLWRSYGISVRVEQYKALLTKSESFNYVQVISEKNGSVLFTSSMPGESGRAPHSVPIVAFSPGADVKGNLVYGHYGRPEDFEVLENLKVNLSGSILLLRFGSLHPSLVATYAAEHGVQGLIFYPDPADFGPNLPGEGVKRASLLTVGQVHDYQKHKGNLSLLPTHTISANDAEKLFRTMEEGSREGPEEWKGALNNTSYFLEGAKVALKVFNEGKQSNIYNVIAAIPGSIEWDRYIILGCSHDSWAGAAGAGDPGIGLAISTELLRGFSAALKSGWRPRRSILIISWDANLHGSSGVSHWIQEHHFEISARTIAYIDMTRTVKGNQSLEVSSSPLLREVVRKAINRIRHSSSLSSSSRDDDKTEVEEDRQVLSHPLPPWLSALGEDDHGFNNSLISWRSTLTSDEPAFPFMGNLGVPFVRLSTTNNPGDYNYPLFHTSFDTFENFARLLDPEFRGSEALGRIVAGVILLLADSTALPITFHDYIKDIRKEFDHFMAEYHEDMAWANLSYASLQGAVVRLEMVADNFRLQQQIRNHTGGRGGGGGGDHHHQHRNNKNSYNRHHPHQQHELAESESGLLGPAFSVSHHRKARKEMQARILNDEMVSLEKAFLSTNKAPDSSSSSNNGYKHQIIGFTSTNSDPQGPPPLLSQEENHLVNNSKEGGSQQNHEDSSPLAKSKHINFPSSSLESHFFPKLRAALECVRKYASSSPSYLRNDDSTTNNRSIRGDGQPETAAAAKSAKLSPSHSISGVTTTTTTTANAFTFTRPTTTTADSSSTSSMTTANPTNSNSSRDSSRKRSSKSLRVLGLGLGGGGGESSGVKSSCTKDWRALASQKISSLVRSLDAVAAILQSPLVGQIHE